MSDLVGNPNCWFCHAQAHLYIALASFLNEYETLGLSAIVPDHCKQP